MQSVYYNNRIKESTSRKVFTVVNALFLTVIAILCVLPFVNLLAVSLSAKNEVIAGKVWFIPKGFTLDAYKYLLQKSDFFRAFGLSLVRVLLGTCISLAVTVLMAYPLAFGGKNFSGRKIYLGIIILSMFFSGGLIPSFIVISKIGLFNKIWALVLPGAMNCWNMILFINFFRQVPPALMESAKIEGAGHFVVLFKIVLPLSMPVVATVTLFCVIGNWNAWFDGYLYMNKENWPLQTYIYHIMEDMKNFQLNKDKMTPEEIEALSNSNDATLRSAQIFIAMLPVLVVYPIAQKYFIKGILLGGVKE